MSQSKKWSIAKKCPNSLRTGNRVAVHHTVSEKTIMKISDGYRSAYLSESREIERMTAAFFYKKKK